VSDLAPWLTLGLGLVILYVLLRLVANPFFWTLAALALVVAGFALGWTPAILLLLAATLAIRWFVRGSSSGGVPREFRDIRDPWGRTSDDPYFHRGPPGPRTDYH